MAPVRLVPLDYNAIEQVVLEHVPALRLAGYDGIVAIARAGLVPGTMLSSALSLPLYALAYERGTRQVRWFSEDRPTSGRLLLVEDIAGRGYTLHDCLLHLEGEGHRVEVFTVASDEESRIVPKYSRRLPTGHRAWFPWERESITAAFAATDNRPTLPDHRYASWAIDLDGVLCPDLPADDYLRALEQTLGRRDELLPEAIVPGLDWGETAIITARPEGDRGRTSAWLERHGYGRCRLVMRDRDAYGESLAEMARFKAAAIEAGRHTHFVESDAAQAALISAALKVARVYWWNNGRPVVISAHDAPLDR
jgi:hypoxanthine phosphoribosyltransferase